MTIYILRRLLLMIPVDPRVRRQAGDTNGGGADAPCGRRRDGASSLARMSIRSGRYVSSSENPPGQPVALELWEHALPPGTTYNTITTWHNRGKDLEYRGQTWYWTKDREFEKFLELPRKCPARFELAATVDAKVKARLQQHGWQQTDSIEISKGTDRYRGYIQQARAEFTVARDQYVRPNTGWFSDRSACYLAAGRPVITQETGFSNFLPTGKGLFGFNNLDDILRAVDCIESDYEGNCRAARAIAAEYFAAEKVVASLMERAGL